ncbi:MAG: hypothetical protein ACOX6D_06925 [Thermoguttaceae bacterium]|jgi:radical SAM superfamily enzyme
MERNTGIPQSIALLRIYAPLAAVPTRYQEDLCCYPLGPCLRHSFGGPEHKISVDAGFSPARTWATRSGRGDVSFVVTNVSVLHGRTNLPNISDQLRKGIARMNARYKTSKSIACF